MGVNGERASRRHSQPLEAVDLVGSHVDEYRVVTATHALQLLGHRVASNRKPLLRREATGGTGDRGAKRGCSGHVRPTRRGVGRSRLGRGREFVHVITLTL